MVSGAIPDATLSRRCVSEVRFSRTTYAPEPVEERELISRVLAGDPSAERALYDAHVDRVFRLAYRMAGDMDRAQDYTQETFIRAFSRLQTFRGDAALSTWLGSIAISVTLNGLRKVRRRTSARLGWMTSRLPDIRDLKQSRTSRPGSTRRSMIYPRDIERCSSCMTSRGTPTRRSALRSASTPGRRRRSCSGPGLGSGKRWLTLRRTEQ